jgi:hypothetical protein
LKHNATSIKTCRLAIAAAAATPIPTGNPATAKPSSILTGAGLPSRRVTAVPKQFHFHTSSEHVVSGRSLPLEMHVVHYVMPSQLPSCPPDGCIVVLGVLFELTDDAGECGAAQYKALRNSSTTIRHSFTYKRILYRKTLACQTGCMCCCVSADAFLHFLTSPLHGIMISTKASVCLCIMCISSQPLRCCPAMEPTLFDCLGADASEILLPGRQLQCIIGMYDT